MPMQAINESSRQICYLNESPTFGYFRHLPEYDEGTHKILNAAADVMINIPIPEISMKSVKDFVVQTGKPIVRFFFNPDTMFVVAVLILAAKAGRPAHHLPR